MSTRKAAVPDAWDDDWEAIADKAEAKSSSQAAPKAAPVILSKAQRKVQHQEANKSLWDAAEAGPADKPIFLQARDTTPISETWKPQLKVLSRKPDVPVNLGGLRLQDDDDSEEEERKKAEAAFAERKARADAERIEKQRKYAEARERIFGNAAGTASSESSPTRENSSARGRGHGRTGSKPRGRVNDDRSNSAAQSPARTASRPQQQLFDPYSSGKPIVAEEKARTPRANTDNMPVRMPKGPDGSGRGGFGFAARGGRIAGANDGGQLED